MKKLIIKKTCESCFEPSLVQFLKLKGYECEVDSTDVCPRHKIEESHPTYINDKNDYDFLYAHDLDDAYVDFKSKLRREKVKRQEAREKILKTAIYVLIATALSYLVYDYIKLKFATYPK